MAQLRNFYRDINASMKGRSNSWFDSNNGLCINLQNWCNFNKTGYREYSRLNGRMKNQFLDAGLHRMFPFNMGKDDSPFLEEVKRRQIYKNKKRLDWIKKHV